MCRKRWKNGCDQRNVKEACCVCYSLHLQELLLDGWYVGDKNGFLDENSFYAELQTGIRVPVDKKYTMRRFRGGRKNHIMDLCMR